MSNPYAPPPAEPDRSRTGRDRHGAGTGSGAAGSGHPDGLLHPAPGAGNEVLGAKRPDEEWPGPLLGPEAFGPQGPHGPGLLGPGMSQQPPPPPDPAAVQRADGQIVQFGLLMLGAVLMASVALPWRVGSLLLLVAAVVAGVRALVSVRRARAGGGRTGMVMAGLLLSGMLSLVTMATVATWPVQMELQECTRDALTVSAKAQCQQEYDQGLKDFEQKVLEESGR